MNKNAKIYIAGHKEFKVLSQNEYEDINTDELILIDIKGSLKIQQWRL